jgi:hypothetical protein
MREAEKYASKQINPKRWETGQSMLSLYDYLIAMENAFVAGIRYEEDRLERGRREEFGE